MRQTDKEGAMIVNKLLTRKGWRVVAHSMLAAAGIGFLFVLTTMILSDIRHGYPLNWWISGVEIALSIWAVVLGSTLTKAELTGWH